MRVFVFVMEALVHSGPIRSFVRHLLTLAWVDDPDGKLWEEPAKTGGPDHVNGHTVETTGSLLRNLISP